jgi:secondary thiamine-phosphate synthase enzyme
MSYFQKEITLSSKPRGFHLVTNEVLKYIPEIKNFSVGVAHIFIKHTSASLSINENADPTVREDMETHFNVMVPEDANYYQHTFEGLDDMTSHIKTSIIGSSVTLPIKNGSFNLGTWQGIYLCEHRNHGGSRRLLVTISGELKT